MPRIWCKLMVKKSFPDTSGRTQAGILQIVLGVEDLGGIREENVFAIEKIVERDATSQDVTLRLFN
jgi:hypothetical protein